MNQDFDEYGRSGGKKRNTPSKQVLGPEDILRALDPEAVSGSKAETDRFTEKKADRPVQVRERRIYRGDNARDEGNAAGRRGTGSSPDSGNRNRTGARQSAATADAGGTAGRLSPLGQMRQSKMKRRRRIIAMIIAECFALLFIFGYAYFLRRWNLVQRPEVVISEIQNNDLDVQTVEKMKGYWTIAIFGVDARGKAIAKETNADVNIICNINQDTGEIKLVSVFRDTYLNINDNNSYNKINQAYFVGGPQQALKALNKNLDMNITNYVTFNWKAVADAIDILGGVDIELSKAEFYYINSFITETAKSTGLYSEQIKSAGMNHLNGVQAVAYGRLRLMDTDYARTERQRKVIQLAFDKAKQADLGVLNQLVEVVFPQVATNVTVPDLLAMATKISRYYISDTTGFPMARGDANMGSKGAVVVPQTLESNVIQLHKFLFGVEDYSPTSAVKTYSAKISADSGMYREGNYVDHVSTEGGVIQKPKATAASGDTDETKESTKETDEDGNEVESETDEDGNVIKKETTEPETDEDGNVIKKETTEPETDEDGNVIDPEEPETDEDGNIIETDEDGNILEPETDEDGNVIRPTRPGQVNPTDSSETVTRPTAAADDDNYGGPGSSADPTTGSYSGPGSSTVIDDNGPGGGTAATTAVTPTAASTTRGVTTPTSASGTVTSPTSATTASGTTTASGGPGSGTVIGSSGPGQ